MEKCLPFWNILTQQEQETVRKSIQEIKKEKGQKTHLDSRECTGLMVIKSGQARVFSGSANGGEFTLFRLLGCDVCILSASCMIKGMDLAVQMEYEQDTDLYVLPKQVFQQIRDQNCAMKEYILELVSEKLSEVIWLFQQYVFSNTASRLATVLLEHSNLCQTATFSITHEILAKDLGTAREVVTRLLKQFQEDGLVKVGRGNVTILDSKRLSGI